ncbi:uncharacterized protein LOC142174636 [Nicotiana tabacum]|uniref:Uncharacterized protein LOC142174636 n=1 Tax=Nicotiana tabacum TaxID=4097 RepID=A0AC58TH72_TOBAC
MLKALHQFREAVTKYAIQKRVQIEKYINEPLRVRVRCMVPKCGWLLAASKNGSSNNFKAKRYNPVHKCYTTNKNKLWRSTAHRARAKILKEIIGDMHQEFKRLYDYRDMILQTNPGSTCVMKAEDQGDGKLGQLLVAVSKDGNNQMFPIAWAAVEGLINVVRDLLPECEHMMCARHILANWSKELRGLERRNTFWRCARASSIAELNDQLDMLDKLGDGICESLLYYRKETWYRAYFNYDRKSDVIDNNMCETFNSWILTERHNTIITMLEEIRIKLMIRICKMREFYETWICDISPIAMKIYQDNLAKSMKCTPRWNGETGYEIEDFKYKHVTKKNRKREETEHPKSGKLSRRGMEMTCSLCGVYGHNKRGCPSKNSAAGNVAAGNATAENATAENATSGGQNPRVISTGTKTKRSTASTEECDYQPRSVGLRWMGKKAISQRQLQRNATPQHNLSQASSSSQPTKKQKKK